MQLAFTDAGTVRVSNCVHNSVHRTRQHPFQIHSTCGIMVWKFIPQKRNMNYFNSAPPPPPPPKKIKKKKNTQKMPSFSMLLGRLSGKNKHSSCSRSHTSKTRTAGHSTHSNEPLLCLLIGCEITHFFNSSFKIIIWCWKSNFTNF